MSDDNLCFVFGGTKGIGAAVTRRLRGAGRSVVVFARNREGADLGSTSEFYPLDLTDPSACGEVIDEAVKRHGAPRYVINCVGRTDSRYFDDYELTAFDEQLRTNYLSCVYLARSIMPHLLTRSSSRLIFCSSLLGLFGHAGFAAYAPSKHAVTAFAECLRLEYGRRGVSVSVFCPPSTDTPGFAEENERKPPKILQAELRGGLLSADAVAAVLARNLDGSRFVIIPDARSHAIVAAARFLPHRIWSRFVAINE